jgi:hypothetical protein
MHAFLVERDMRGSSALDLTGLRRAAARQAQMMHEAGDRVRYVRSVFLPQDGRCLCLFEAKDAEVVRQLNREAMLTFDRIVPATEFTP